MKLMLLFAGILMALGLAVLIHGSAHAELEPGVRIVLVQATGAGGDKVERIDIQNDSDFPIDVTSWKLLYKSASGGTVTSLLQISAPANWSILLAPGDRESFVSKELVATMPLDATLGTAEQFNGAMNHSGGGLQLVDANGAVKDSLSWGSADVVFWGGPAAPAMTATTWLVRQGLVGTSSDFVREPQDSVRRPLAVGALQEVPDVCINLSGLQQEVPEDYIAVDGNCQPIDVCSNLDGVQMTAPEGMEELLDGSCEMVDRCDNLPDLQAEVPARYELTAPRTCEPELIIRKVLITELLPNPSGSDDGSEFIELYNADTEPVALKDYMLMIGTVGATLPADRVLAPGEYLLLSDTDLGRHLPNTTGVPLYLLTVRNVEVMAVPAYMNAKDDASWALIDGTWQYTFAPTPGAMNVALATLPCTLGYERDDATGRCRKQSATVATATPAPCRDGQYRNEETGRCRNIAVQPALTPCKDGQYRSEETNRCRSFATLALSALKPCADDQFRNPVTNRCKSIASTEDVGVLADCGEGRERNPTTNRCRNVVTAVAPLAAFKAEPMKDTTEAFAGWWALGGVGVLAAGYAGWEWRRELGSILRRASLAIRRR